MDVWQERDRRRLKAPNDLFALSFTKTSLSSSWVIYSVKSGRKLWNLSGFLNGAGCRCVALLGKSWGLREGACIIRFPSSKSTSTAPENHFKRHNFCPVEYVMTSSTYTLLSGCTLHYNHTKKHSPSFLLSGFKTSKSRKWMALTLCLRWCFDRDMSNHSSFWVKWSIMHSKIRLWLFYRSCCLPAKWDSEADLMFFDRHRWLTKSCSLLHWHITVQFIDFSKSFFPKKERLKWRMSLVLQVWA